MKWRLAGGSSPLSVTYFWKFRLQEHPHIKSLSLSACESDSRALCALAEKSHSIQKPAHLHHHIFFLFPWSFIYCYFFPIFVKSLVNKWTVLPLLCVPKNSLIWKMQRTSLPQISFPLLEVSAPQVRGKYYKSLFQSSWQLSVRLGHGNGHWRLGRNLWQQNYSWWRRLVSQLNGNLWRKVHIGSQDYKDSKTSRASAMNLKR